MATVGVNGAAAATLNERFIKCPGCKVNIPKEDMLSLGKCTVCKRPYEAPESADPSIIPTVPFAHDAASVPATVAAKAAPEKPTRKRWMMLTSKRGRTYYHNTETGEDTWEKPIDSDADAVDTEAFVPFKNDTIKNAVLREQAKIDATKMGLPVDVIEALQHQQRENESDPVNSLLQRPTSQPSASAAPPASKSYANPSIEEEEQDNDEEENESDADVDDAVQAQTQASKQSPGKPGSCVVM